MDKLLPILGIRNPPSNERCSHQKTMEKPTSQNDSDAEPLRVTIVGGGIGGLATAVGLRRNGHQVTILEQSALAAETGAAVHLMPNANGILRRWGIFAEKFGGCANSHVVERAHDGRLLTDLSLLKANERWAHPWLLSQRSALHGELKKLATQEEGPGEPAVLRTSSRVVGVDVDRAMVKLDDGTEILGDVVLGADGVYSATRSALTSTKPRPTGQACFRFQVSRKSALEDAVSRHVAEPHDTLCTWYKRDRRVVMYPCAGNGILNFVCMHPDGESHSKASEGWDSQGDIGQMLKVYADFDPAVKAMVGRADPDQLRVWRLLDMEQIPWTAGKLALLGDAAHPFTPHQGQGAGMAIEDAASLSVILSRGASAESVPERLKLYEAVRRDRAHVIQEFSRQAGRDWVEGALHVDNTTFNYGHDALDFAARKLKQWQWSRQQNAVWSSPTAFGPVPGPLQDGFGRPRVPRQGAPRDFTTLSIRFKTSRTLLENLFPTEKFHFRRADTICVASWSITSLDRLPWLAGEGYQTLGLFVHGVSYKKKDGTSVNGAYVPVLFESLTDAVVSGREQLGLPKFGCDVALHHRMKTCRATASWRGATFIDISLDDLVEDDPASETGAVFGESNVLGYRYVPALGEPGRADAEYPCVVSHADEGRVQNGAEVTYVARSRDARISCAALDWDALPTLHHVASALAEVPVYEVVSAKLVKGRAAPDVPVCRRIE
ncbi:FAD-dependent monooxygenase OpS4 [Colletotrichum orbiculare MAFF 240422]|uniref:FAD-dependent monooxygenase OpS4 n=1 Tax=Colletotrichum orbiculare (strain 104-T / ATCC 96160 / CBS 514.97 / LARS 414 / MAFF 240422) TaxID=1213857 RepID=N4V9U7_COLOR|nr:FAD-dependent monooxygenase OpS4 [Colletotrichum orbiculare MAFF 240422]